jgi:PPP family 3-phenylpropionic acid transporter
MGVIEVVMKDYGIKFKICMFYLIIYGSFACYSPFLAVYFANKGLSYTEIGIAFAVNSLVGVIAQPIWGYVTDKYLDKRKTLIILMSSCSVIILLFLIAKSFIFIIFSIFLLISFQSAICSVADAYSFEIVEHNKNIQYGRIRLMGSFGYAVLALIIGIFIKYTNINSAFYTYSVLTLGSIIVIKSIGYTGKGKSSTIDIKELFGLLKYRKFLIFIISVLVFNMAQGANGSYLPILVKKTGGDVSQIGLMWFIVAIFELPVLYLGHRFLKKYGAINLYIFSAITYTIRFLLDGYCTDFKYVLILQCMQSITYTFFLISSLQYVNDVVPLKMRTSGITMYSAVGCGLGGFGGNMFGGILLEKISIFSLYKILALVCILTLIISLYQKNLENRVVL